MLISTHMQSYADDEAVEGDETRTIPVDAVDDNDNDEVDYNEIGDVDDELTSSS